MRRQVGGFGFVMLLVVVAVILFVAARNWKAVAPAALDIHKKNGHADAAVADSPEEFDPTPPAQGAAGNTAPPVRPSLSGMEKRTTAHTDAVRDALGEAQ